MASDHQDRLSHVFRRYFTGTLAAVSVLLIILLLYQLRHVLLMVAMAGFFAYFLAWPANWLSRKLPRKAAVRVVFYSALVIFVGSLGPIGGVLYMQVVELIREVPGMLGTVQKSMENWSIELIPGQQIRFADYLAQLAQQLQEGAPRLATNLLQFSQSFLSSTALIGAAMFAIPLITLYFLLDSQRLRRALLGCFSARLQPDVDRALDAINTSLSGYIYGKTLMSLFVGVATWLMLIVLGVPFSVVLALLAFVGEFIPVVGSWIAFAFVAVVVIASDPLDLAWIIVLTLIIQMVQNYIISPKLMGDKMNLHPLTVVIAMLMGGTVGGVAGLVLALPAAAAAKILLNVFVFRREERGIIMPQLDLISTNDGGADFKES